MNIDFDTQLAQANLNHRAAQAMDIWGGGFASALAVAYFRADADNQARMLAAWPNLFERYRQMARRTSA